MKVEPGQLIGGKYELERLIGKGSMGEVWRARHATLEDSYAVKLIDVRRVADAAGRFQLEAHIAAKLSKKTRHIVSVTDHGADDELAYLVMQLLEGESLEQRIEEAAPLSLAEVSTIVTQVARALKHAHDEGFVHRDLKPANVFLTKDEDGRTVVKLLDFGIARSLTKVPTRSPFATAKDTLVGTPSYMSPEQTLGLETIDHRCDLWSLAVVAYESLSKALPFEGETLQDVLINIGIGREVPLRSRRDDLPDAVYRFFEKAFGDELMERFSSATELATAFAGAAGLKTERPSMAPPLSMTPPPSTTPAGAVEREPVAVAGAGADRAAGADRDAAADTDEPIALPMQRGSRRTVLFAVLGAGALIAFVVVVALRGGSSVVEQRREANAAVLDASRTPTRAPPSASASAVAVASGSAAASASASASASAPSRPLTGASTLGGPATALSTPSASAEPSAAPAVSARASSSSSASSPPPPAAPARSVDRGEVF